MKINGIAASDGITMSKVFKLVPIEFEIPKHQVEDIEKELSHFSTCLDNSSKELEVLKQKTLLEVGEETAEIFEAHKQICLDPEIKRQVEEMIEQKRNAVDAYSEVTETFASMFEAMDNDYFKERAVDVRDVSKRVIAHLLGIKSNDPSSIKEEVIVVADDLTPSDTAQLDKSYIKGFATNIGGRTSHAAIMCRSLELPAVVGTKNILEQVNDGDFVILNGIDGYIIIDPTKEEIDEHNLLLEQYVEQKRIWNEYKDKESISQDGTKIELAANIGTPEDMEAVLKNGAEGVGLYRTEFLYMNSTQLPTEEEQFKAYKAVLEQMGTKKVVIRTLDIGGDKQLDYLQLPEELNPFLGHRALRLCLEEKELFKTQLRALLRASVYGNLHIMFPMVATINELRDAKALLKECEQELEKESVSVSKDYKVGIMVEIPAVAILADQFAKEVDFFSIGTNDLIQYTFAADRMNQKVSYLYQPYNPSLLRLIKLVIDASHKEGIWTGMCGEMAGDKIAIPLLFGLGLDEFSMSSSSVLPARYLLSKLNKAESVELAKKAINSKTNEEVITLVKEFLK